jgi:hypothetical protein
VVDEAMRKTTVVLIFSMLSLLAFNFGLAQSLKNNVPSCAVADTEIIPKVDSAIQQLNLSLSFGHIIISSTDCAYVRSIGDVDGDGFSDVIVARDGSGLTWYRYPNWSQYFIKSFNWRADDVGSADIDGDGDTDVVGVQDDDGKTFWFENPRPSGNPTNMWTSYYIGSSNDYVKDLEILDFDNDGKLDVVTRTESTTSIFLQNNATSWNLIKTIQHHKREGLAAGDLDKDGDIDIVLNGFWLENPYPDLSGTWYEHNIDSKWWNQSTGQWEDNSAKVFVIDINLDSCLDVVLSNSEKPDYPISWYEISSTTNESWIEHVIGYLDYCHTLQAGDMDKDNDIEIVAGKFERDEGSIPPPFPLMVFSNKDGDGLSWDVTEVSNLGIYSGVIGDIGNDGDLDIVGSRSYWKGPIEIWENKASDDVIEHISSGVVLMTMITTVTAALMLMRKRKK